MKSSYLILALIPFLAMNGEELEPIPEISLEEVADFTDLGLLEEKIKLKEIDPHTLIHKAILENSSDVVLFLLNQGVSVDQLDQNGMTPLTIALMNRCSYAVEVLLSLGANPNAQWKDLNLLELAYSMQDAESSKKLLNHGANNNNSGYFLAHMIQTGIENLEFAEIAKIMIQKGADLKIADVYSAIMYAEFRNDPSILSLILEKGFDLNRDEKDFPLPIVEAARRWNPDTIKLLVKSGANLNQIERRTVEETALIVAIYSGHLDRVKLLVELGADVNQKINCEGAAISPLRYALINRYPDIVQYLLQRGAKS